MRRGKALAAGAVLGGSVLAQMLLTPVAEAHNCGPDVFGCTTFNTLECLSHGDPDGHCYSECDNGILRCHHI